MKVYETLDLTAPDTVVGRHGVWLPRLKVKVPFQWAGRIQKYQRPQEASYPLGLLGEEVGILRALAEVKMAPPIGQWVFFKTVISEHPGGWWADPCGAYGYEMEDAHALVPGHFDIERLRLDTRIAGSPGAWNDLLKPGNVINGYLVDIHRSGWDRLRWDGPQVMMPHYMEDRILLRTDLLRLGAFPFRERDQPYQEYWLDGRWWPGEREVVKRAALLGFQASPGDSVLDIGTCLGGFLHRAWQRAHGEGVFIGLDTQPEYVDLARRLARAAGANLCIRQWDISRELPGCHRLIEWLQALGVTAPTHLLLLSMLKHLPKTEQSVWEIVDALQPGLTYLETNAVKEGHVPPFDAEVKRRGGRHMGWSRDRNHRALYQVGQR